jgi:hypothetical protein
MDNIIGKRERSSKDELLFVTKVFAVILIVGILALVCASEDKYKDTLKFIVTALIAYVVSLIVFACIPGGRKEIMINIDSKVVVFKNVWLRKTFWSFPAYSSHEYKYDDILGLHVIEGSLVTDYYIVTIDGTIALSSNVVNDEIRDTLLDIVKGKTNVPMRTNPHVYMAVVLIVLIIILGLITINKWY